MLVLECEGSPFEVGVQHGKGAVNQVKGSLTFYSAMFQKYTGKTWSEISSIAAEFHEAISLKWPRLFEEIRGIAVGSESSLLDIIALNVRTEIAFGLLNDGMPSDGCTSLAWKTAECSWLCQNWDWMEEQEANLVQMTIVTKDRPSIKMITEAGIVGKIGLNAAGVGVCLNAVRSKGYDAARLPVHLGLRLALESSSAVQAVEQLELTGMAGSAHILIADKDNAIGCEFTSRTFTRLTVNNHGQILHTNHMIAQHDGIDEMAEKDSFSRLERLQSLVLRSGSGFTQPNWQHLEQVLDDHDGFPESICRSQQGVSKDATLFSIVMELKERTAVLVVGKQCQVRKKLRLNFS